LEREPITESFNVASPADEAPARNDRALAGLRIAVGILFLVFGEYKVFGSKFVFGDGFQAWIQRFLAEGSAYPFMVPILRGIVLPHGRAIAFLVSYGELAIGLSLVLGLWVRLASGWGLVYMLALLFSANYPGSHAVLWQYFGAALEHLVLVLCFGTFLVGAPERAWSLTRAWRRRSAPSSVNSPGHG
jgi:thiosulfate dehydrogenase (quinone) large subunit